MVIKPVGKKVEIEGAGLPKEKVVDHSYGSPKKSAVADERELRSLVSFKGSKVKLPPIPKKVCGQITATIEALGKELASKLPRVYQKALENAVQTYRESGRSEEDLAATRFAVAQFLTKKLEQSEC